MSENWTWLIGRKLSMGRVIDVCGEMATVQRGANETRVLLCELLEEDYKAQDRYEVSMCEVMNSGNGAYWP